MSTLSTGKFYSEVSNCALKILHHCLFSLTHLIYIGMLLFPWSQTLDLLKALLTRSFSFEVFMHLSFPLGVRQDIYLK